MASPEVSDSSSLPFSTRRSDLVSAAAWFLCTISLACSTPTCRALTPDGGRGRRACSSYERRPAAPRGGLLRALQGGPLLRALRRRLLRPLLRRAPPRPGETRGRRPRSSRRRRRGGLDQAQPGAAQGTARSGERDSFCVSCGAGFSSALCGHHVGHETFRVVVCEGLYCARCTGSEPWFHLFTGIQVRILNSIPL
jgi:hypothetical protein